MDKLRREQRSLQTFHSKIDRSGGPDACWPWTGCLEEGYGRTTVSQDGKKRRVHAHRLAYEQAYGCARLRTEQVVMHRCDNPPCCNPAHLSVGTPQENRADCVAKNRHASGDRMWFAQHPELAKRGSANGNSRLTEEQVIAMREMFVDGASLNQAARAFGVSKKLALNIKRRRIWNHV